VKAATKTEAAFWDTSGIALLCAHQAASGTARQLVQRSRRIVMWWGTPVEAQSAFARLFREKQLSAKDLAEVTKRLAAIQRAAAEILPTEEVRQLAQAVLSIHDLRAGDAFQLAAALVLTHQRPRGRWFVCFDRRLGEAADRAGFTVMPPP
jgi:hypothetical protein